jgi:hypothetical protein
MVKKDLKKYNDWKASQANENENSEAGLNGNLT